MNFLDTYDIMRSSTPNPAAEPEQPSLNEEVNQVMGQLGRFWGGFRKQSQVALETARKDLSEVVVQAQKELSKLTTNDTPQETAKTTDKEEGTSDATGPSTSSEEASTSHASTDEASASSGSTQTLFSRLQAALPPNIVTTVQNNIPESLKHASENIDLQQMRTNLLSELQRVQGVTLAQAEEYAHKSEALLREAVKEAGEVLRDAVKVLPPDQAGPATGGSSLVWDGADMWMLPSEPSEVNAAGNGKEKEGSSSKATETQSAVASRAEALLRRLKHDPDIIRHDPEVEVGVKDQYLAWREKEVDTLTDGPEGAQWKAKISAALEDPTDSQPLKQLEETLVPSEMTKTTFWRRFFFRTYQIRIEEEKRKALLRSSIENEEEFSWEDEEEEQTSPAADTKQARPGTNTSSTSLGDKKKKESLSIVASGLDTGSTTSPRLSSEDSFDLVSSTNASVVGDEKPSKRKEDDDEGDSDWE